MFPDSHSLKVCSSCESKSVNPLPQSLNKIILLEFQWVHSSCGHLETSPLAPPANCRLRVICTGAPCSQMYRPAGLSTSAGSTDLKITPSLLGHKSKYKHTKMDSGDKTKTTLFRNHPNTWLRGICVINIFQNIWITLQIMSDGGPRDYHLRSNHHGWPNRFY